MITRYQLNAKGLKTCADAKDKDGEITTPLAASGSSAASCPFSDSCNWVNLAAPTDKELHDLQAELDVPLDMLTDSLDPLERPHIRIDQGITFFVIRVSAPTLKQLEGSSPFTTLPIGILLTPSGTIATVCSREGLVEGLIATKANFGNSGGNLGHLLALRLIQQASIRFVKDLQELDNLTGNIEQTMQKSMRNQELRLMMTIQKTLVYFMTSLKGNQVVLEKIETALARYWNNEKAAAVQQAEPAKQTPQNAENLVAATADAALAPAPGNNPENTLASALTSEAQAKLENKLTTEQLNSQTRKLAQELPRPVPAYFTSSFETERELLQDALTECRQAVETAGIYANIISSMNETFAAMISNNMNAAMKFLAGVTLILTAPTIIVGFFGMNVPLPFSSNPYAIYLISAGTAAVCWVLWRILSQKHWM